MLRTKINCEEMPNLCRNTDIFIINVQFYFKQYKVYLWFIYWMLISYLLVQKNHKMGTKPFKQPHKQVVRTWSSFIFCSSFQELYSIRLSHTPGFDINHSYSFISCNLTRRASYITLCRISDSDTYIFSFKLKLSKKLLWEVQAVTTSLKDWGCCPRCVLRFLLEKQHFAYYNQQVNIYF